MISVTHVFFQSKHVRFHSYFIKKILYYFFREQQVMSAQKALKVSSEISKDSNQNSFILKARPHIGKCDEDGLRKGKIKVQNVIVSFS